MVLNRICIMPIEIIRNIPKRKWDGTIVVAFGAKGAECAR
jgi:hypothetical protein